MICQKQIGLGRNFRKNLGEEIGIVVQNDDVEDSDDSDLVMSYTLFKRMYDIYYTKFGHRKQSMQ